MHSSQKNEAKNHMDDNSIDIALLQDLSEFYSNWKIFTYCMRSAHLVVRYVSLIINHLYTGDHSIFLNLTVAEGELITCSTYLASFIKNFIKTSTIGKHSYSTKTFSSAVGTLIRTLRSGEVLERRTGKNSYFLLTSSIVASPAW